MSTNKNKIGRLEALKRETFKLELNSKEYDCYDVFQKNAIMSIMRLTDWEFPFARTVFQSETIKKYIDIFSYIFSFLNSEFTEKRDFASNLIDGILNNLEEDINFPLIIEFLTLFVNSFDKLYSDDDSIDAKQKRQAVLDYSHDLLFKKEYDGLGDTAKLMLFESVINSSSNGLYLGEKLLELYQIIDVRSSISRLMLSRTLSAVERMVAAPTRIYGSDSISTIAKVFEGNFDSYSDISDIIIGYYKKYVNQIPRLKDCLDKFERNALISNFRELVETKEKYDNLAKEHPDSENIEMLKFERNYAEDCLESFCHSNPDVTLDSELEDMTSLAADYKELFRLFKSLKTCVELASSNVPIDLEGVGLKVCDDTTSISRLTVSPKL